jgi:ferredoxin-NADP reductase
VAPREVELLSARTLSPSVRSFVFRCSDGAPLGHVAGQWVNLRVPLGEQVVHRAYSVASAPGALSGDCFELAVTRVDGGPVSSVLHAMQPGERVEVDGPHGFFTREGEHDAPALLVATGTGLCPFRAMLQAELAHATGPRVGLLFGCRTEDDILWRSELDALAQRCERFSLYVTLSRAEGSWQGRRGYVQQHVPELISELGRPVVYVCGLTRMVQEVRRVLKADLGYDRKQIRSERYD